MGGFIFSILRFAISVARFIVSAIRQNPLLTVITTVALLVRVIGLFPHDIYNADEQYIRDKSGVLFFRIVTEGDFDPHTYKYGSLMFYWGALPYFVVYPAQYISDGMSADKYTHAPSNMPLLTPYIRATNTVSFSEYVKTVGINQWPIRMLKLQRFSSALLGTATVFVLYLIGNYLFSKQ